MRVLEFLLLLGTGTGAVAVALRPKGPGHHDSEGFRTRLPAIKRQQDDGQEVATYDDACNIGFCSVWGA